MSKKLECKKELKPGVQKHDVVDFIIHLQIKAERANAQDKQIGIRNKRQELFLTSELSKQIRDIANAVQIVRDNQSQINCCIDELNKNHRGWYSKLSLINVGPAKEQTLYDAVEDEILKHFSSPELEKYITSWEEKQAQTKRAYKVVMQNIKSTRSLPKMSEYLLSMGFDISKIEPREHEKAEKQPAPKFSKDVLFPCVKN